VSSTKKLIVKEPGHELDGRVLQVEEIIDVDSGIADSLIRTRVAVEAPKKKEN
jgi:hypothetical protein